MSQNSSAEKRDIVIPLYAEEVSIERRKIVGDTIRVTVRTNTTEQVIDEHTTHTRVIVECTPIGKPIDSVPPVRTEADTIVIPVVEEVIVVARKLVLKEEIRVRRVQTAEHHHRETVNLREQYATIERVSPDGTAIPCQALNESNDSKQEK
jgi:stress response protein YsnF